jgi:Glycosyl hydrolases family 38 N-terminal domain/Alpha mannosidase middle domain
VRACLLLLLSACSAAPAPTTDEGELRARLGIPESAKRVVIFQQSAHLDIDWQHTFDEYYSMFVKDIFVEARQLLDAQPRAHYSITEMGYLSRHLDEHPEELAAWQSHAARGALHIVGGGMTSPDTLLPETELLFRDFLYGTQFAEETFGIVPRAAWLPDSFGHAATVPDVLAASGFTSVGFARVDGAPTFYESIEPGGAPPPRPGSSAELLAQMGAADFTWTGPGGGQVLAHWIASGLYCTGDNIDYDEQLQIPGGHLGVYDGDQPNFTDGKIDSYVAALAPYAKTPYLFVPVGCDFQHPKDELISYLDGYNRRRSHASGVWTVAASFDEYARLVAAHPDALPSWSTELSPYFMGFYASRAAVKRAVRDAARPFFEAESFAVALGDAGRELVAAATPALRRLTLADHHDFVTGTAKDEVVTGEQLPLAAQAQAAGEQEFSTVAQALAHDLPPAAAGTAARLVVFNASSAPASGIIDVPWTGPAVHDPAGASTEWNAQRRRLRVAADAIPPFGWRTIDLAEGGSATTPAVSLDVSNDSIVLQNARVRAAWSRGAGATFALTSLTVDGSELIAAPSFTLTDYADQGGLWRLGNEMPGCSLTPIASPSPKPDVVQIVDRSALSATVRIVSPSAVREARLDAGDGGLRLALIAAAALGTTRTATFRFASSGSLRTSLAGGFAEREPERVYTPTFWPAVDWLSVGPAAILLRQSTGARLAASGEAELMAMRWAPSEECDIEGGMGDDAGVHRIEWMLTAAASPAAAARAAQSFNRPLAFLRTDGKSASGALAAEGSLVSIDGEALISALKPADRGDGVILRALLLPGPATVHLSPALASLARTRTDALERDLADLGAASDTLLVDAATFGSIATVRLH